MNVLRLFKTSKIGFYCPLHINKDGGGTAMADPHHTFHSFYELYADTFSLTREEKENIKAFYNNTYTESHYTEIVEKMIPI